MLCITKAGGGSGSERGRRHRVCSRSCLVPGPLQALRRHLGGAYRCGCVPHRLQVLQQQGSAWAAAGRLQGSNISSTKSNPNPIAKSNPMGTATPRRMPIGNPNRCGSLIVGRSQNAARGWRYAPAKNFAKFPYLTVDGGRKCRYSGRAPWGSLASQPMTASSCGGGRPQAVLRGTPRNCERRWDTYPRPALQPGGSCSGRHP